MNTLTLNSPKHGSMSLIYDDQDEELIYQYSWIIFKNPKRNVYYAHTNLYIDDKRTTRFFHRLLLGITDSKIHVDHINHNGLDNRRENLRICSHTENMRNRRLSLDQSSQYKGVYLDKRTSRKRSPWTARIRVNTKMIHLGCYFTEEDAALSYNTAALQYFGEFAFLNDIA